MIVLLNVSFRSMRSFFNKFKFLVSAEAAKLTLHKRIKDACLKSSNYKCIYATNTVRAPENKKLPF